MHKANKETKRDRASRNAFEWLLSWSIADMKEFDGTVVGERILAKPGRVLFSPSDVSHKLEKLARR